MQFSFYCKIQSNPVFWIFFSKVKTSYQLWTYYARSFRIKWLCNFHYSSSSRVNCILTREEKTSENKLFLQKFTLSSFKYHKLLKNIILRRRIYIWAPSFFLSMHTVWKVRCCYITLRTGSPKRKCCISNGFKLEIMPKLECLLAWCLKKERIIQI